MAIALTRKFGMPGVDVVTVGGAAGVAASAVEPKPAAAMAMAMAMLTLLPVRQRTVVTLRDIDGLASEEVCELLGITAANQRVLLHRARTRLREALEDYYRPRADRMIP